MPDSTFEEVRKISRGHEQTSQTSIEKLFRYNPYNNRAQIPNRNAESS